MIQKIDISTFLEVDTVSSIERKLVERFKLRRRECKLSQRELAERTGVSYGSIRRFESTGEISLTHLLQLAFALNCQDDFAQLFSHSKIKNLKDMK